MYIASVALRARSHCDDNGIIATHVRATELFPMRTASLASLQSCHSIDADAWCKQALRARSQCHGNGIIATHFRATELFPMRTGSLASLQSCRSVDADTWCKQALRVHSHYNGNGIICFILAPLNADVTNWYCGTKCWSSHSNGILKTQNCLCRYSVNKV